MYATLYLMFITFLYYGLYCLNIHLLVLIFLAVMAVAWFLPPRS